MGKVQKIIGSVFLISGLAGCGSLQESFELFSFQPDLHSEVKNQIFEVFFLSDNIGSPLSDPKKLNSKKERFAALSPSIRTALRSCEAKGRKTAAKKRMGILSTAAPLIISYAANAAYDAIKQSISTKADQISKASQRTARVRLVHKKNVDAGWRNVNCVIVTRYNKDTEDPGLFVLFNKTNFSQSSVLTPAVYWLGNSIALTAKGTKDEPASAKVDIGLAIHAVTTDRKTSVTSVKQVGAVKFSSGSLKFGKVKTHNCALPNTSTELCAVSSPIIPHPPKTSSALMVSVNIVETGTSANAKTLAQSANKALDGIAKPILDEIVKEVTSQITN